MKNVYGKELDNFTRLTRHYQDWEVESAKQNKDYITTDYFCPRRDVSYDDCLNKLGLVEDIEEKRGIKISVLDRIFDYLDEVYLDNLDKPFYEKDEFGIHPITPVFLQLDLKNKRLIEKYHPDSPSESIYPFSEYGKTWALTREELNKE